MILFISFRSISIVRMVIKINFASIFTIRKLKIISGCVEIYNGLVLIPKLPKLYQNCQNWLHTYLEMYPVLAFIPVYLPLNKANIATDYCSYKRTAVEKSISRFISKLIKLSTYLGPLT